MSTGLGVRPLSTDDVEALASLLGDDGGYALRVSGRASGPAEADDVLRALPPGVGPDAKVVLGLFDGAELVGVADVVRGWPAAEHAHVGLLLTAASRSRHGLGRRLHDAVVRQAATWDGVTTLRLGVVETNREQAEPFWRALGYRPTDEVKPYASGTVVSETRIWTRPLPPPEAYCSGQRALTSSRIGNGRSSSRSDRAIVTGT